MLKMPVKKDAAGVILAPEWPRPVVPRLDGAQAIACDGVHWFAFEEGDTVPATMTAAQLRAAETANDPDIVDPVLGVVDA